MKTTSNQKLGIILTKVAILHLLKLDRPTKLTIDLYKSTIYDSLDPQDPIDAKIRETLDYWHVYYTQGVTR